MSAIGSLRVELEMVDGSFTTRVIRAGTTLRQLETQVGQSITAVRQLDSTFSRVGGGVRDFVLTLGLARAAVENVATVFGGLPASILRTAGEIERLTMLLSGMSTAASEAGRAMDGAAGVRFVRELSQRAPFALETLTNGFVRLRAAGIDPTNGSLQGLVDAVAAFGGSREQFDRATVAIQQMAGKGVISLEELRQQLGEAVPNAIPLMARAMGATVDQLVEQIALGRVRAGPALEALSREFERTFGGAAQRMMQTFRGQLQLLQTNWQTFQMLAAGDAGSNGFLDAATRAVERFNEALSSPEGRGFAIYINQTFRDMTDGLMNLFEVLARFRTEIGVGLQIGAALIGFRLLIGAVQGLGVALNTLTLGMAARGLAFLTLSGSLTAVSLAAYGAATALSGALVRALVVATTGLATASAAAIIFAGSLNAATITAAFAGLGATLGPIMTSLGGWLAAGTMAVVGFKLVLATAITGAVLYSLVSSVQSIGGAFNRFGDNVTTAAGSFGAALASMGNAAADRMPRIGNSLEYLGTRFMRLFSNISSSVERLRMGATDGGTLDDVRASITLINEGIQRAPANLAALQSAMENLRQRGRTSSPLISAMDGGGIVPNVPGGYVTQQLIQQRQREIQEFQQAGQAQVEMLNQLIVDAEVRRNTQLGAMWADGRIAAIERGFTGIRAVYNAEELKIAEEQREIQQDRTLSYEEREARLTAILQRQLENRATLYRTIEQRLTEELLEARRALASAGNEEEQTRNQTVVDRLLQQLDSVKQRSAEVARTLASSLVGSGSNTTIEGQAQTQINNMERRIAQLRQETQGLEGGFASITTLLNQAGWDRLPQVTKDRMRELARQVDELKASMDRLRAGENAGAAIREGVSRAESEFNRYAAALRNPTMTEAQRSFTEFQRRMNDELGKVAVAYGMMGEEFEQAAQRVSQAVEGSRLNTVLEQVARVATAANAARLQNLSPNERLAEEIRQRTELVDLLKQQLEAALAAAQATALAGGLGAAEAGAQVEVIQQAIATIERSRTDFIDNANRRATRANASAGAGAENQVTRMTARLAEMRSEIATGQGEYAKMLAQLTRTGQVGSAAGQQMLNLARQVDELSVNADRARAAWGALESIVRDGAASRGIAVENLAQIGAGALAEPRQIVQALGRIRGAMAELQDLSADPAAMRQREEAAERAMAGIRARYVTQQAVQYADQARTLQESLANSLSERRGYALRTIDLERDQFNRSLQLSNLNDAQKRQALETFETYAARRREQALQETENGLERMMRDWGRLTDNTFDVMASGIDKLTDGLIEFATTGKANFADMAKSILADLAKIQLRAAASGIFQMISGAIGGGGTPGVGTGSYSGAQGAGYFGAGPFRHGGGLVGTDAATFTRMLDYSVFANARRLHTGGLADDEVPTILQKGEGVFTEGQMAAIGRMNHSYTAVEQGMMQLARALPAAVAPRDYAAAPSGGAGGAGMPGVRVNLINESGEKLNAVADQPYMDMEGMVVDVVLRNASRPGPLRDLIRGG